MIIVVDDEGYIYRYSDMSAVLKDAELDPRSEIRAIFDENGLFFRIVSHVPDNRDWREQPVTWESGQIDVESAVKYVLFHVQRFGFKDFSTKKLLSGLSDALLQIKL